MERARCGEQFAGRHMHKCWRGDGHYDEHICECDFDWPPGAEAAIRERAAARSSE